MIRFAICTAAVLAGTALAGCGRNPRQPEPLVVSARSGARIDLTKTTWEHCLADTPAAGRSQLSRIVHGEKGVVTYASQDYDAPGCAGNASPVVSVSAFAFAEGDRTVGWAGTPPVDVPAPVATRVILDTGASIGADCFWLDDVSAPRVLYASPSRPTVDPEGFPNQLSTRGWPEVR